MPIRIYKKVKSTWNKGLKMSEEYRHKLSLAHLGHKQTEETKRKISLALSKRIRKPESYKKMLETKIQNGTNKLSEESKKNMSESRLRGLKEGRIKTWCEGKKLPFMPRPGAKGRKIWNKGMIGFRTGKRKPHSEEAKLKMSINRKNKYSAWNKGLKMPDNFGEKFRGKNHYAWNPNREAVRKNRRDNKNADYHLWARSVKRRDGWKCKINNHECCGKLEAHHILPWSKFPELRYEINNGITLCHYHHPRKRDDEIRLTPFFQKMLLTVAN